MGGEREMKGEREGGREDGNQRLPFSRRGTQPVWIDKKVNVSIHVPVIHTSGLVG